jgi:hypothetical protein
MKAIEYFDSLNRPPGEESTVSADIKFHIARGQRFIIYAKRRDQADWYYLYHGSKAREAEHAIVAFLGGATVTGFAGEVEFSLSDEEGETHLRCGDFAANETREARLAGIPVRSESPSGPKGERCSKAVLGSKRTENRHKHRGDQVCGPVEIRKAYRFCTTAD